MNKQIAWILGMLLSDDNIVRPTYRKNGNEPHLSFICKHSDTEVLYKIKNILKTSANVRSYPEYKSPYSIITIYDKDDLINKYNPIKTQIPNDIKGFERHFIRGLFDRNGTLSKRKNRNSFRIGFINEFEHITEWVSKTICNMLNLPKKNVRYIIQNNVYEILWEGNIAKLIAFWLYSGDISDCSLKRKYDKYHADVLNNQYFKEIDKELLYAVNAYIDDNNEIAFNIPGLQTLEWCKRVQKLLSFNTVPVFHNKGKRKYYHLYIP